jgi:hypothetical protein
MIRLACVDAVGFVSLPDALKTNKRVRNRNVSEPVEAVFVEGGSRTSNSTPVSEMATGQRLPQTALKAISCTFFGTADFVGSTLAFHLFRRRRRSESG